MPTTQEIDRILQDTSRNPDGCAPAGEHFIRCHCCHDPFDGLAACSTCHRPTCPECLISGKCVDCFDTNRHGTASDEPPAMVPGPWQVMAFDNVPELAIHGTGDYATDEIATVQMDYAGDQAQRHAQMLAAAPELADAAMDAYVWFIANLPKITPLPHPFVSLLSALRKAGRFGKVV